MDIAAFPPAPALEDAKTGPSPHGALLARLPIADEALEALEAPEDSSFSDSSSDDDDDDDDDGQDNSSEAESGSDSDSDRSEIEHILSPRGPASAPAVSQHRRSPSAWTPAGSARRTATSARFPSYSSATVALTPSPRNEQVAADKGDGDEGDDDDEAQWVPIEVEQVEDEATATPCSPLSARSAASRRLFATLSRDSAAHRDQAAPVASPSPAPAASPSPSPPSAITRPLPSFSARRGHNMLPSLDQIRSRVSGLGIRDSPTPVAFTPAPAPAQGSPAVRTARTPSSQAAHHHHHHHRSVSCPSPKIGKVWHFGEMTVTVTPPTPRPQPGSPVMGYVLQNAGQPVHPVRFRRSRDDLELLVPPAFELAPGRQQMIEERARRAMETMAALHSAAKGQHRIGIMGNGGGGGCGGAHLIGLGWPGSPMIGSPSPITTTTAGASASASTTPSPRRPRVAFAPHTHVRPVRSEHRSDAAESWRNGRGGTSSDATAATAATARYVPPGRRNEAAPQATTASPRNRLQLRVPSSAPVRVNSGSYKPAAATTSQQDRVNAGRHLISRLAERERAGADRVGAETSVVSG
ncbi:unnamed protein product [Parajaminaea phylloscopi]